MRIPTALRLLGTFAILVNSPVLAKAQDVTSPQSQPAAMSSYPDSADGVKSFVADMLNAVKSGDNAKTSLYLSNLTIPDHSAWFANVFGPTEGTRLDARYSQLLPQLLANLPKLYKSVSQTNEVILTTTTWQKPVDPAARMMRAVTEAMIQPTIIYSVTARKPDQTYLASLGDFVFVAGQFRYLEAQTYQALSTAPPMRIRVGGQVSASMITKRVQPIYPPEAKAAHTTGTVVLQAIIGTDGTIKELIPVSGDPILTKAAVDAVQQWRYKPYLLNGIAVEVQTIINVDFQFH